MTWNWSEVSRPTLNPDRRLQGAARLIPGAELLSRHQKKSAPGGEKFAHRVAASPFLVKDAKRTRKAYGGSLAEDIEIAGRHLVQSALKDYILVLLDWILVAQIFIQFHVPVWRARGFPILTSPLAASVIGIALLHAVLIQLLNLPARIRLEDAELRQQNLALGKAIFWATLVLSAELQLQGFSGGTSVAVWSAGLLHVFTLCGWRWSERGARRRGLRLTRGVRNVLIVGAGTLGQRIASYVGKHPEMDRSICGFLDDKRPLGNGVIGRTSELVVLARAGFVDEVILAPPYDQAVTLRVLHTARQLRLDVKMAPHLFGCEPVGNSESIGSIPLISLHQEPVPVGGLLLKRALDVAGAATALLFMAPALLVIALLIRADSSGSVLYQALRAGRRGRPFRCYKFRTMQPDADDRKNSLRGQNQRIGPFFKIRDDPRITGIGRFLRRYSLDELPQLWNVLKGDMSLVGPRPHPLDDVSAYEIEHLPRLDVAPGMTGLWQVTARQNPSFQIGMKLDIEYIHRWSLKADLLILFKTAGVVLRGSGE
jgi:exopolysaccharide biosynthesis polyprenyl glycosylphosphotransferase